MPDTPTFRFAPSPNGYLHLGHAFSALTTYQMAEVKGGTFLLRIEDIDQTRTRPEYEHAIYEDLAWLGITWETPVRRQSEHMADYKDALQTLQDLGVLYPCFASRRDIKDAITKQNNPDYPKDPDGAPLYPGLYKGLSTQIFEQRKQAGEAYVLRLDMQKASALALKMTENPLIIKSLNNKDEIVYRQAEPEKWGDVILARKDIGTSYHIAVVVDDALQKITHVTRGQDLYHATDLHRLLQTLLGLPTPIYYHHKLIEAATGEKLSKSQQSPSIRDLRLAGSTPQDIRTILNVQT